MHPKRGPGRPPKHPSGESYKLPSAHLTAEAGEMFERLRDQLHEERGRRPATVDVLEWLVRQQYQQIKQQAE